MRLHAFVVVLVAAWSGCNSDSKDGATDAADTTAGDVLATDSGGGDVVATDSGEADGAGDTAVETVADTAVEATTAQDTAVAETALGDADSAGETVAGSRILVSASGIVGRVGKVFVAIGPDNKSSVCAMIMTDPFSLDPTPLTEFDGNPCPFEAGVGAEALFDPGEYAVVGAIMTPGVQAPDASISKHVVVGAGDASLAFDGTGLSANAPLQPGTVTLSSTTIRGRNGLILLAIANDAGAHICAPITSNAFTLAPTAMTDTPSGNPCGESTNVTQFTPGHHSVLVGVWQGGQQDPLASTTLDVEVDGNQTVQIDGALLSP